MVVLVVGKLGVREDLMSLFSGIIFHYLYLRLLLSMVNESPIFVMRWDACAK